MKKGILNIGLMEKVRAAIADEGNTYRQTTFFCDDSCQTPGCVAGWTLVCAGMTAEQINDARRHGACWGDHRGVVDTARRLLGISDSFASHLFCGQWSWRNGENTPIRHYTPTRKDCVAVLDRIIDYARANGGVAYGIGDHEWEIFPPVVNRIG